MKMKSREVISVDITETPDPYDEVTSGEIETAKLLKMNPEHLHRILDLHTQILGTQARARRAERLASPTRTVVE
jgi:hypothetical protein